MQTRKHKTNCCYCKYHCLLFT